MALTKCNVPGNVIGSLATRAEERGLTTQEFKDKFDEMPEGIKQYINEVLTEEIDAHIADYLAHKAEDVSQGNPHGIDAKADKSMGETLSVVLQNGWSGTLAYSKNDLGQVWLRGHFKAGTTTDGTVIGVLPEGYRPGAHSHMFLIYKTPHPGNVYTGCLINRSTGEILIRFDASKINPGEDVRIDTIFQT